MAYLFILMWRSDPHWTWSVQVTLEIAKEAGLYVYAVVSFKTFH